MQDSAYLILENGTVFAGKSFGYAGETIGEVVFTTSMTGYLETLTDPSFLRTNRNADVSFDWELWRDSFRF